MNNRTSEQNSRQEVLNKKIKRSDERTYNEIRPVTIERKILPNANGSALICLGKTHIICSVSIMDGVPNFRKNHPSGWLTAEYGMLPAATQTRSEREAKLGKQNSRTQEIQRLIGRSLRAAVNLNYFRNKTIQVDCDVISADGGTRTASITGAYVALVDAIMKISLIKKVNIADIIKPIAAISVGIVNGKHLLDLDYCEDAAADCDINVVMDSNFNFIEIQGTAERSSYSLDNLKKMLEIAQKGIAELISFQQNVLA